MAISYEFRTILPMLFVGIVTIVLAAIAGPSCAFGLSTESFLEESLDGARFKLLHWSHPDAPHFVPGLSFLDRMTLAAERSMARAATMHMSSSGGRHLTESGASAPSPVDFTSPTFHDPSNLEYAMEITIGTPPRTFSVIADTGSDLVWVQCTGCNPCEAQADPLFVPADSSSYASMSCSDPFCIDLTGPVPPGTCSSTTLCSVYYGYVTGATIVNLAFETITLNTTAGMVTTAMNFAFGCATQNTFDVGGLDGFAGLGRGPLSFTTQLGSLFGNKFSYCLVSIYDSNTTFSPLILGEALVPITVYTPMVDNPNASYPSTYYYIGLTGIKVNGVALTIPAGTFDIAPNGTGGVILDSGTVLGLLVSDAYNPLVTMMQSLITYPPVQGSTATIGFHLCYDVSAVPSPVFPVVTLVFTGFEMVLPLDNTFVNVGSSQYCMAFSGTTTTNSIVGNIQQQNFQILFDREAKRFGFAPYKCDTL